MAHVCVLVLGDIGRSPRMQYHAQSLANLPSVARVSLIGYCGEECIANVRNNRKITDIRVQPWEVNWLRRIPILHAITKGLSIVFVVLLALLCIPSYDKILIQNPPALPALLAALLADLLPWRSSRIILDWHNLGFAMFQERLGERHPLVLLALGFEKIGAKFAQSHICVSSAMSQWLKQHFGVVATVLYDRPAASFQREGSSLRQRHELFLRLGLTTEKLFPNARGASPSPSQQTIHTKIRNDEIELMDGYGASKQVEGNNIDSPFIPVVVSSTSWTPDEDFDLLLNALLVVEKTLVALSAEVKSLKVHLASSEWLLDPKTGTSKPEFSIKRAVVCVTGKGPLKSQFEQKILNLMTSGHLGTHIAVKTLWLTAEDYPVFMGCCSLGVSLHTSTSGLDLPMKILDMFGSGLPVCAVHFPTLPELVQHNSNGLIFGNAMGAGAAEKSAHLAEHLLHCLFDVRPQRKRLLEPQTTLAAKSVESVANRWKAGEECSGLREGGSENEFEDGRTLLVRLKEKARNIQSWDQNWTYVMCPMLTAIDDSTVTDSIATHSFWMKQIFRGVCWAILTRVVYLVVLAFAR